MTKYHITAEPDGRLPVLRHCWVVWRVGASGEPEFHGAFASAADAETDPIGGAPPAVGWKIARVPLIAWNAIALRGGAG